MISKETIGLIRFSCDVSNIFFLIPVIFDSKENQFAPAQNWYVFRSIKTPLWKLVSMFSISTQVVALIYFLVLFFTVTLPTEEIFLIICISCIFALSLTIEHFYLTRMDTGILICNNYLSYNRKYLATFEVKPPDKDGNEKFLKILILLAFLAPLIEIPGFLLLFSQDFVFMRLWLWLLSPLPYHILLLSFYITGLSTVIWTHSLIFMAVGILVDSFILKWIQERNLQ